MFPKFQNLPFSTFFSNFENGGIPGLLAPRAMSTSERDAACTTPPELQATLFSQKLQEIGPAICGQVVDSDKKAISIPLSVREAAG